MDTATIRGIFPILPKQTPEIGLAACTDRFSTREPQSKNGARGEKAADDLGEAADKGTDDALKAEGAYGGKVNGNGKGEERGKRE